MPPNAVEIGARLSTGEMTFVGRARFYGDLVPGTVVPSRSGCCVGSSGKSRLIHYYQVLTSSGRCHLRWVPSSHGIIPIGAVEAGRILDTDEPLFIGRAMVSKNMIGGRVQPSKGVIFIPYAGKEITSPFYEVLCKRFLYA